jgi:hypothetical protein
MDAWAVGSERDAELRKLTKWALVFRVLKLERSLARREAQDARYDDLKAHVEQMELERAAPHGKVEADVVRWLRGRGYAINLEPRAI